MAPSTALVVASSEPGRARTVPDEDDVDLPVDLSQLPMIPMAKSLLLVNNFVANTTRFLNHFANDCEERITRVSTSLTRVEIMLAILEAKLDSIPDLDVTESEVQAAGQSISGEAPLQASVEPSIGIDSQDLPSTDDGFGFVPPPPPPPPPSGADVEAENRLVVGMPPPPPSPPPGLPSFDGDGGETSNALVIAPSNELAPAGMFGDDEGNDGPPVLKLKDDPIYAKYFTMRRLGIPDPVIEQKLMLDGMDPSILSMNPEGPSPSAGGSSGGADSSGPGMSMPPPPPPGPPLPPSGNIGMPFPPPPPPISPTSSTSSRAESLFGSGPTLPPPPPNLFPQPPMPPMPEQDDDDSSSDEDGIEADAPPPSSSAPTFLKLKDDPAFAKYFTMRKLGMPDGVIQHKLMMDGVTLDILSMDPEGPSPNAGAGAGAGTPPASSSGPPALPPPHQGLPPPPAGRPGLPPPPVAKYDGSDDDFDSDSD